VPSDQLLPLAVGRLVIDRFHVSSPALAANFEVRKSFIEAPRVLSSPPARLNPRRPPGEGAIVDFSVAIRPARNESIAYLNCGAALKLIRQNARALAVDDFAIRLDPSQSLGATSYNNRGNAWHALRQLETKL
jgi:hypothetical protein